MGIGDQRVGLGPRFSKEVLRTLTSLGTNRSFPAKATIFELSSPGNSMYVIESGEVDLIFAHEWRAKRLVSGDIFGELALITANHRRTATAVAVTDTVLREVGQDAFDHLLTSSPSAAVSLMRTACTYLLDSEQELIRNLSQRNREIEQALDYLRRTKEDLDTTELLARTDELTGLYNRRCLHEQTPSILEKSATAGTGLALLITDLDFFKQINDSFGHHVGDLVLKAFSKVLRHAVRQSDLPFRIGGDEFAILLSDIDELSALTTARRIRTAIGTLDLDLVQRSSPITCSIGGTMYRADEPWVAFFERADHCLLLAKQAGRDRIFWNGSEHANDARSPQWRTVLSSE